MPPSQNVTLSPSSTQNHPQLHIPASDHTKAPEEAGVEVGSEVGRGRHAEQCLPDAIDDDDFNRFHSDSDEEAAPSAQEVKSSPQHSKNVNIRRLRSRSFDSSLPRPRKLSTIAAEQSGSFLRPLTLPPRPPLQSPLTPFSSHHDLSLRSPSPPLFEPAKTSEVDAIGLNEPEKSLLVVNGAEKDYSVDAIEIETGLRELADDRWLSHGTIVLLGRIFSFPGAELLETAEPEDN
ncbi:hypothetical protein IWX49DRAFT_345440 [Phyllosticta citricarpa]|uniref:Uncharacterized protein n=1 Tax=Phyllosticta paracitricarpa TaxID=2016321 RepID=A0ABR1MSM6_9PEZI